MFQGGCVGDGDVQPADACDRSLEHVPAATGDLRRDLGSDADAAMPLVRDEEPPVRRTLSVIVFQSIGATVRRSMTVASTPWEESSCAVGPALPGGQCRPGGKPPSHARKARIVATVTFEDASRIYPKSERRAVDRLGLEVSDGEFLVLLPSPCCSCWSST